MGWGNKTGMGHGKGGPNTGMLRPCIEKKRAAGKNQFAARTACAMEMKRKGKKGPSKY